MARLYYNLKRTSHLLFKHYIYVLSTAVSLASDLSHVITDRLMATASTKTLGHVTIKESHATVISLTDDSSLGHVTTKGSHTTVVTPTDESSLEYVTTKGSHVTVVTPTDDSSLGYAMPKELLDKVVTPTLQHVTNESPQTTESRHPVTAVESPRTVVTTNHVSADAQRKEEVARRTTTVANLTSVIVLLTFIAVGVVSTAVVCSILKYHRNTGLQPLSFSMDLLYLH